MTVRVVSWVSIAIAVGALLAGCASVEPGGRPCARLGAGRVCLAPPQALVPPHSLWQMELVHGARQENLLLDVESDAAGVQLVGLTPLGQKLMHLQYGATLNVIARPPAGVDAVMLMVLVQHALWPTGTFADTPEMTVTRGPGQARIAVPTQALVLTLTLLDSP